MKEHHNACYNSITPESSNAEFLERVLRKAETMNDKKRSHNKKPLIIAAAAALTLCVGVSAAAATGLIDFNTIFGDAITAENEQLGAALIGDAANVRYSVSNADYVVSMNGVTGSSASLIASFEISRADGLPIGNKDTFLDVGFLSLNNDEDFSGSRCSYEFNENGNIEITYEHQLSFDRMLDDDFLLSGAITMDGSIRFGDNGRMVDLDWQTDFAYTPSAHSLKSLDASVVGKPCTLNCGYFDDNEFMTVPCTIEVLRLTSTGGAVMAKLDRPELFVGLNHDNTLRLIKTDGSEVIAAFSGGYASEADNTIRYEISFYTDDTLCHKLAVDLDEIAAISINGTVYDLV